MLIVDADRQRAWCRISNESAYSWSRWRGAVVKNAGVVASVHSAAAAAAADVSASVTSPAVCFAGFLVLVLCKRQNGCVTY